MPLTSAQGSEGFDPYAEEGDTEATPQETPVSVEETPETVAEPPDVGSEPVEEPVEDIDPLAAAQAEAERLQKQLRDKDSHIGQLEGENRGYREVLNQYPQPEPEAPAEPASVFDDEGTQSLLRQAYDEEPFKAIVVAARAIESANRETVQQAVTPLAQQSEQERRLSNYQSVVNNELLEAANTMPGAKEIVEEYLNGQGQGGRLVEKIKAKAAGLQAMGANPQMAAVPGSFKSAIAEILVEGGNVSATPVAGAPATARPKARNVPDRARAEPTPETIDEDEAYTDSIVNAVGPADRWAEILK